MAGDKGRGGGAGEKRRPRDLGRGEWRYFTRVTGCIAPPYRLTNQASRQNIDKRARNEQQTEAKRRKIENGDEPQDPIYATQFSKEEIDNEERRPKKKAAVLLGYSGTGYSGMQLYVELLVS